MNPKQHNLLRAPCPYCKRPNDIHDLVDTGAGTGEPVDGDTSICIGCAGVGIFEGGKIRPVTVGERAAWTPAERAEITRIQRAIRKLDA